MYEDHCAVCHGGDLLGSVQGPPLVGAELVHGDSLAALEQVIARGVPEKGMPGWSTALSPSDIRDLAILISEQRAGFSYSDFRFADELEIPAGPVETECGPVEFETVIAGLDPHPYAIAPLPNGDVLLTEKFGFLTIVSEGKQSAPVEGAPVGHQDATEANALGIRVGVGWLLDVAVHPDYERNGWIYLSYGDRCKACNSLSRKSGEPVSMLKVVRGRLAGGRWVDGQVIWQADVETYTSMTDGTAAGRLAVSRDGYAYFTVGMKGMANYVGIQNLGLPYGKTFRLHDDGRIPADNPFVGRDDALPGIWTYGHRVHQGLEVREAKHQVWSTEMGPRGGDEVNLLLPGRNYGWPLQSLGMNYDGTPVAYGKQLGIDVDPSSIEQTRIDLTPSPAISNFVFYQGEAFPGWSGDLIAGSLKARELFRYELDDDDQIVHVESLIESLGRIRDVAVERSGTVLLLLEHASGGRIVRMKPVVGS